MKKNKNEEDILEVEYEEIEDDDTENEVEDEESVELEYEEDEEHGITNIEKLTDEDILLLIDSYFSEEKELLLCSKTFNVIKWQDTNKYDLIISDDTKTDGYDVCLNKQYDQYDELIEDAVPFFKAFAETHSPTGEIINKKKPSNKSKNKSSSKSKKSSSSKTTASSAPKKTIEKFSGPRIVRVYGNDIYVEEDPNATYEDIRKKLVNDYGFPNFTHDKASFYLDESNGILEVHLKFQQKG